MLLPCVFQTSHGAGALRVLSWAGAFFLTAFYVGAVELPLTISIEKTSARSEKGWGAVGQEEDTSFLPVKADIHAWFRIHNWWGDTIRPPEGKIYVVEVRYKDTLQTPAKVMTFGGMGRYFGAVEVHRIGGLSDGKWKVAHVPISWDLLMLPKGTQFAQLGFRTAPESADLPVASITVRDVKLPEDKIRYEAESRAWVAQVQKERSRAAVPAARDNDKEPAIPDAFKEKPFVPFVRPYYNPIHPFSVPQKKEAGATLHIRMARNEYEPGAFAVYAQQDLAGVTFEVSELKGPSGILKCNIRKQAIEFALMKKRNRKTKETTYSWSPQRIWDAYPVPIEKGKSALFWITIETLGQESMPGRYRGMVTIRANGEKAMLPLEVDVQPLMLLTMDEAGLRMGGCVTGLATASELKTMREHNHNMFNIWWAGVQPGMTKVGEKIELDFYYMDDFMKRAKKHGINTMVWFLGGNPNGYPETLSAERDIYHLFFEGGRTEFFKKQKSEAWRGKILPEVRPLYKQVLKDIVAHAKENDWPELVLTPFDEPAKWAYTTPRASRPSAIGCGPWTRDHFKAGAKLIHEAVPGTKVYVSMHRNFNRKVHGYDGRVGEIFIPDVDVVCTNAIDEDHDLGNKTRRAGKDFWQYAGRWGGRYTFGWWFARWGSTGSLCWAYNWDRRLDISGGSNWIYAWYSPFGTILTPTYEDLREGWDDRRYWATLEHAAKKKGKDVSAFLDGLRKDIMDNRGSGGRDLVNDFWEEGKDANAMDKWRKQLADKILEVQKD